MTFAAAMFWVVFGPVVYIMVFVWLLLGLLPYPVHCLWVPVVLLVMLVRQRSWRNILACNNKGKSIFKEMFDLYFMG